MIHTGSKFCSNADLPGKDALFGLKSVVMKVSEQTVKFGLNPPAVIAVLEIGICEIGIFMDKPSPSQTWGSGSNLCWIAQKDGDLGARFLVDDVAANGQTFPLYHRITGKVGSPLTR